MYRSVVDIRSDPSGRWTLLGDGPIAVKERFLGVVPLHRYGTNEEIARLVLFLASDEASYCTGGVYVADGGFVAG